MRETTDRIRSAGHLGRLIQKEQFVGWAYSVDYQNTSVLTNDYFKREASGVPHNAFLTAATFDPERMSEVDEFDQEVILLRVVGTADLPHETEDIRTKIDHLMRQESPEDEADYDELTLNQLQFSGLKCRILGTFYVEGGELKLGSDIESFYAATHLKVYRPIGDALKTIVNYVDPIRKQDLEESSKQLGLDEPIDPFRLGTVRYTSTDRLHRGDESDEVAVFIEPIDFLARRTALFGMTRTGKSNAVKQLVSVVKRVSDQSGLPIGQIIYDVNGEYANPNRQDEGALSEVYPDDEVVRYRMGNAEGFEPLQNNFYRQIEQGHTIIDYVVRDNKDDTASDVTAFLEISFEEPPQHEARGEWERWRRRVAIYKCLLYKAGFDAPEDESVEFTASQEVRDAVEHETGGEIAAGSDHRLELDLDTACRWFLAARRANNDSQLVSTSSGDPWFDSDLEAMANMLAQHSSGSAWIKGYKVLIPARKFHSPHRSGEVGEEIYDHLQDGRIVILDLSVGDPRVRGDMANRVAKHIFQASLGQFVDGERPPEIMIYIEESHNVIGKNAELHETWPRIAKEGAKYRLGLVYATQEPSSMHPNILANTENWIVTHLNNENEVRKLGAYYDFADFERSLMRAQDVGFARVKTLSGPFVLPVQVDKFDPVKERERAARDGQEREAVTSGVK